MQNARLKALAQVTADTMQRNAALRQMDDTLKLAADFSSRAAHDLDDLMGGSGGLAKKFGRMSQWRRVPDRYLAYLYGVAPLADDLVNGFETLNKYQALGFGLSAVLRAHRTRYESIEYGPYPGIHNGSGGYENCIYQGSRKLAARCAYRFDLPDWFLEQNGEPLSPWSEAYELTKMSFVLDWFVPVGDWIGALESAQWSPYFVEGWETMYFRDTYDTVVHVPASAKLALTLSSGSVELGRMNRVYVSQYPWGSIFQAPAINPLPSWSKAAQGSALLTQAFKRWY
jgi:hypothetical protein